VQALASVVPPRPPGFCTGCPERPIFAAMKLVEKELGPHHVSADIGCHLFSILPPFNIGATTMGYGLGPAAASAFNVKSDKRVISVMGDGGFWHNGLSSSVGNAVFNKHDGVMLIVDNFYSAATGGQDIPSSRAENKKRQTNNAITNAVKGVGATWVRQIDRTYDVAKMRDTLREALTTDEPGPKIIVASSECMLNKQRRVKPLIDKAEKAGEPVLRQRFGIDEDICTGDHACIRLSGCPSLTVKQLDDPLRDDPVAAIDDSCVGLRQLRRRGGCRGALPLLLPRRRAAQCQRLGALQEQPSRIGDFLPAAAAGKAAHPVRPAGSLMFDGTQGREKPLSIAILAMGGQGGGVLTDWIVAVAEANGWHAQSTSVPGVAQRTGATLYYIEMLPPKGGQAPGPGADAHAG
jgi:pyruvate/2-oxoacid:ferredoxin oxidoreductase beta subunit